MKEDPRIDEVLSSFIDNELSPKQRTNVQRLIAQNRTLQKRLRRLQKCRMLISSLPPADAPADIVENVKAALERKTLLSDRSAYLGRRQGARRLFVRRFAAAAAMITLVAVLSMVIYSIVAPQPASSPPAFVQDGNPGPEPVIVKPAPGRVVPLFAGKLELRTSDFLAVDTYISRMIRDSEDAGLLIHTALQREPDRSLYSLSCSRQGLNSLLSDIDGIWQRFDAASLSVESDVFDERVVVDLVTTSQIVEIAGQDSIEASIRVAHDFAVLNGVAELMPGKEVYAAVGDTTADIIPMIPKPRLTGPNGTAKDSAHRADKGEVRLIIIVAGR